MTGKKCIFIQFVDSMNWIKLEYVKWQTQISISTFLILINVKKMVILLKKNIINNIILKYMYWLQLNVTNHEMMYCILRSACVLSHPCDIQTFKSFQLSNCLYYVLLQQTKIIFNNNGLLSLSVSKYFSINLQKQFRRSSG